MSGNGSSLVLPDSFADITHATSMTAEDVYNTLVHLNMISHQPPSPPTVRPSPGQSIKFPKGRKNGIARRHLQRTLTNESKEAETPKGPFEPPKHYEIVWDRAQVDEYMQTWEGKGYVKLRAEKLQWTPYVLSRNAMADGTELTTHGTMEANGNVLSPMSAPPESTRSLSEEPAVNVMLPTRSMSRSPVKQSDASRRRTESEVDEDPRRRGNTAPSRRSPRKRRRFESLSPEVDDERNAAAALFDEPLEEEGQVNGVKGIKREEGCRLSDETVIGIKSEEGSADADGESDSGSG